MSSASISHVLRLTPPNPASNTGMNPRPCWPTGISMAMAVSDRPLTDGSILLFRYGYSGPSQKKTTSLAYNVPKIIILVLREEDNLSRKDSL